jgi:hypothetical protein
MKNHQRRGDLQRTRRQLRSGALTLGTNFDLALIGVLP